MNAAPIQFKMLVLRVLCGAVAFVMLFVGTPSSAAPGGQAAEKGKGVMWAIQADKKAGRIDEGRAALYRLWAATDHKKLPAHIRKAHQAEHKTKGPSETRCGTPMVIDVLSKLHLMDAETRRLAQASLPGFTSAQPTGKASGAGAASAGAAKTRPFFSLPNLYETPNFIFGWFDDLTNEDGSLPLAVDPATGIPKVVLAWAKYMERSFEVITTELGFSDAGLGGLKIPVAISSPTAPPDYSIGYGTYGITSPGSPPAILLNYDFTFVVDLGLFNDDADGDLRGAMKVTAAHELLHVFHYLYDRTGWNTLEGAWWMEASSTWVEDHVFAQVNDYVNYLYFEDINGINPPLGWFVNPEWSLEVFIDSPEWDGGRQYGDVIFAKYLSEHLAGPPVILESWEKISSGVPLLALDAVATSTVPGWTTEDLYLGFSGANATLDYEDKTKYLSGFSPDNYVRSATLSVDSSTDPVFVPDYLGAAYLKQAELTNGGVQTFEYTSPGTSPSPADWGLGLVHLPDGAGYSVVLAGRNEPTLTLANAGVNDVLYGVPSFLDWSGASPISFVTLHTDGTAPAVNTTAPDAIVLAPADFETVDPAMLKVDWTDATDPADDIGGYIVQYRRVGDAIWASRTIYGENSQAWLGGLEADADYDVQVAAYDIYGNVGAFSNSLSHAAGGAWPATDAELPAPPNDPTPAPVPPGGGGGGGGCFLEILAPAVEIRGL